MLKNTQSIPFVLKYADFVRALETIKKPPTSVERVESGQMSTTSRFIQYPVEFVRSALRFIQMTIQFVWSNQMHVNFDANQKALT